MTLHDHFQAMVTAEDELETISQRLLAASIKLARAPNHCIYFDSTPQGITAAHNCTLKAVAVQVGGQAGTNMCVVTLALGSPATMDSCVILMFRGGVAEDQTAASDSKSCARPCVKHMRQCSLDVWGLTQ